MERPLARDPVLSVRLVWTLGLLAVLYGGVVFYTVACVVLWAYYGGPAIVLVVLLPATVPLLALIPFASAVRTHGARPLAAVEAPEIHAALDRLCELGGITRPRLALFETDVPDAFAVGFTQKGSTIVVTRGLLDLLPPEELEAVLAHELAHVANRDGALMTAAVYPLFAVQWLFRRAPRLAYAVFLPPFWGVLLVGGFIYWASKAAVLSLSRLRELYADRGAALLTGAPQNLMSALQRIAGGLERIPEEDLRRVAPLDALLVIPVAPSGRTHPPLEERLARLAEISRDLGHAMPPARRAGATSFAVVFFGSLSALLLLLVLSQQATG